MRSQPQDQVPLEILLIEDDLAHAELIVRSFEDHPIANRIHHLADGEAALDYLFHRGDPGGGGGASHPHMVLLDLRLPKVDGLEVLKRIRSQPELDRMPVVVLTTSRADTDVRSAYRYHANSYLVKPLDFPTFSKMMDDIGYYWLGWNHHPDRAPGYWL